MALDFEDISDYSVFSLPIPELNCLIEWTTIIRMAGVSPSFGNKFVSDDKRA